MSALSPLAHTGPGSFILRHVYGLTKGLRWVTECGDVEGVGAGPPAVFLQRPGMMGIIRSRCLVVLFNAVDPVLLYWFSCFSYRW